MLLGISPELIQAFVAFVGLDCIKSMKAKVLQAGIGRP